MGQILFKNPFDTRATNSCFFSFFSYWIITVNQRVLDSQLEAYEEIEECACSVGASSNLVDTVKETNSQTLDVRTFEDTSSSKSDEDRKQVLIQIDCSWLKVLSN